MNKEILQKIMEEHGAIAGDWRHFFDDLEKALEEEQETD